MTAACTKFKWPLVTVMLLFAHGLSWANTVIVRGDNNYPPYEFVDSLGKPAGFNIDLLNALAEEMDLKIDVSLGVWDSVRKQLSSGEIDLISGMFHSRERAKQFEFSVPFIQVSHALFVSRNSKVQSLEDLVNRRVLVQQGDIMHEMINNSIPAAVAVGVSDPAEALRLLDAGKYECALLAKLQGSYLIRKNEFRGIGMREIPFPPRDYCLAVHKDNPRLVTQLNEGLNILRENGTYRNIHLKWFGITSRRFEYRRLILHGVILLSALVIIIALVLLWNATLRKTVGNHTRKLESELRLRERAEKDALEKTQHLQLITDNIPVLIAHVDADENYLFANDFYGRLTGLKPERIIGKKTWEVVSEHYYKNAKPYVDRALRGERVSYSLETALHTGEKRNFHITYVPDGNSKDRKCGFFALTQDVTEYVLTENALRESETNLNITLQSIGDAVIATDSLQRVTRMNPIAEQLTGWRFEEAQGKLLPEVFRIINAHTRRKVDSPAEKVLRQGRIVGLANHTILVSRDGTERQIADSGAPIRDARQAVVGVVLVFRDVTESYELEEQLRQAQKMDAIGQLAGGIAHDFNNQLAGIMGYADLISELSGAQDTLRQYSENIIRSVGRASDLTNKLLAFARKGKYQSLPVNLHSVISEVVSMLEHTIDRRISIRQHLDATPSATLGDPSQLQNALLNIAINARDAMPKGGELLFQTDTVRLYEKDYAGSGFSVKNGAYVHIKVRDSGTGMDPKIFSRIFEPFFTTKDLGLGTGMGLAAVYGTMKNHNGAITVESKMGEGSTFNLFFPVHDLAPTPEKPNPSAVIQGTGRVLLVDDEMIICQMASDMLQELGYEVIEKHDGQEAVEYFRSHHQEIDLVVLDLVMPRMSGVDTYLNLREIDKNLTVLVSSGYSIDGEAQKILAFERSSFIQKPYKKADLSQAVAKALSEAT